jgi:Na+/alanine symporter
MSSSLSRAGAGCPLAGDRAPTEGWPAAGSADGGPVFALGEVADVLYALWLLAAFSLVYAATRHEQIVAILDHSWRFGAKVMAVLLAAAALLAWMSWGL